MIRRVLLLTLPFFVVACGKPSIEGQWTGDTGPDGYGVVLTMSGGKVDIDFTSHKTTAKLKANGTYKIEEEKINTTIEKAMIDKSSLTGQMKEITKEAGVIEATEKVVVDLLSRQLSGPYKLENGALKIVGNPATIILTKKN